MPFLNDKPSFLSKPNKPSEPVKRTTASDETRFDIDDKGVAHVGQETFFPKPNIPAKKHEESLVEGDESLSRYTFNRSLEKNWALRKQLARELNIKNPYSPEVDKAIKDIEAKLPESFGSMIDETERQNLDSPTRKREKFWRQRIRTQEEMKDGMITRDELIERDRAKVKESFFRRLLGLTKKK